jgi:hypothetical protein
MTAATTVTASTAIPADLHRAGSHGRRRRRYRRPLCPLRLHPRHRPAPTPPPPEPPPPPDTDEAGASFACSLDGAAFAACTSPQLYNGLAEGPHTFAVRATDPTGNTDPTPATGAWTVDTTPRETTITSAPITPTAATTANFAFSSGETRRSRVLRTYGSRAASSE